MKCAKVKKRLSSYLDKRVDEQEAREIQSHLKQCPGCRAELKLMRVSHESLAALGPAEVPKDLASRSVTAAMEAASGMEAASCVEEGNSPGRNGTKEPGGLWEAFWGFRWPAVVATTAAAAAALVLTFGPFDRSDGLRVAQTASGQITDPVAEVLSLEEVGLSELEDVDSVLGESDPDTQGDGSDLKGGL